MRVNGKSTYEMRQTTNLTLTTLLVDSSGFQETLLTVKSLTEHHSGEWLCSVGPKCVPRQYPKLQEELIPGDRPSVDTPLNKSVRKLIVQWVKWSDLPNSRYRNHIHIRRSRQMAFPILMSAGKVQNCCHLPLLHSLQ